MFRRKRVAVGVSREDGVPRVLPLGSLVGVAARNGRAFVGVVALAETG